MIDWTLILLLSDEHFQTAEDAAAWVAAIKAGSKKDTTKRVGVDDFTMLKLVGKGNFGKVFQVNYVL